MSRRRRRLESLESLTRRLGFDQPDPLVLKSQPAEDPLLPHHRAELADILAGLGLDDGPRRRVAFMAEDPGRLRARLYGLRRTASRKLWLSGRRLEATRRDRCWRRDVRAVSRLLSWWQTRN